MVDYGLKAELIANGSVSQVNKVNKAIYAQRKLLETGEFVPCSMSFDEARQVLWDIDPDVFRESQKILFAQHQRTKRLRSRIEFIIRNYENSTFVTLTFTDTVLQSTSDKTRRKYVELYLKEQSGGFPYIANIDFGSENGREHYHAVCGFRLNPSSWSYGALNVKKIRKSTKPIVLAKYVSKLTNHAIKETCRRACIIYSRGSSFDNQ